MNIINISRCNISKKPFRSFCLIFLIMIFTLAMFAGSVFSMSLSNAARSMAGRMGADIMIVPENYDPDNSNILLAGKPSTFYLPSGTLQAVSEIKDETGIETISPQTFLATLNASCCAYPVQLVGIDYNSDFIIKAWQKNLLPDDLKDGEIITGYQVAGWPGDKIKFFGKNLTVAGRLDETGLGFDAMIFMNMNTILMLAHESENITGSKLLAGADSKPVSVLMIKLAAGQDSAVSAIEINRLMKGRGVKAIFSKKLVSSINEGLNLISSSITIRLILLWLVSVIITGLIFAMTFNERKKEFGILRALGASKGYIMRLCMSEIFITGLYGSFIGLILGTIIIIAGSPFITKSLSLPFIMPSWLEVAVTALFSTSLAILTGIIAGFWPVIKSARSDIQNIMAGD